MRARYAGHHHDTTSGELIASLVCLHPGNEGGLVHAQVGLNIHGVASRRRIVKQGAGGKKSAAGRPTDGGRRPSLRTDSPTRTSIDNAPAGASRLQGMLLQFGYA